MPTTAGAVNCAYNARTSSRLWSSVCWWISPSAVFIQQTVWVRTCKSTPMYTAIHASCSSRSRTVQGESTNSRPGGACLMTSLTENKQLTPVQCALTKSLDLKSFRMRTYEKQRSEEHTSELQSLAYLVCRLLL